MKRMLFALVAVVLLAASPGCQRQFINDESPTGGPGGRTGLVGRIGRRHARAYAAPGPPTAQVAYPYYTVRGPRDFFAKHPPSTGPY